MSMLIIMWQHTVDTEVDRYGSPGAKKIRTSIPPIERQYRLSILASEMSFSAFDLQQDGAVELAVHQHDPSVDDRGLADKHTTQAVGCDELLNAGRLAGATASHSAVSVTRGLRSSTNH